MIWTTALSLGRRALLGGLASRAASSASAGCQWATGGATGAGLAPKVEETKCVSVWRSYWFKAPFVNASFWTMELALRSPVAYLICVLTSLARIEHPDYEETLWVQVEELWNIHRFTVVHESNPLLGSFCDGVNGLRTSPGCSYDTGGVGWTVVFGRLLCLKGCRRVQLKNLD